MDFENIITEERGPVFIVTLDRPRAKNAIDNKTEEELTAAFDYWEAHDELRACIITNTGDVFCAGSDLKEIARGEHKIGTSGFAGMTERYFDKPLIAAPRGKVLGGGLEMVVACELAVSSDDAIFGYPEPRVGLTAAGGGSLLRVGQSIPLKHAMELLLTAEPIGVQKALDWGLINYAVPTDQVLDKAIELAEKIALGAPLSIKYTKRTVYETLGESPMPGSRGWEILHKYQPFTVDSEDAIEGSTAFAEKRAPQWKGR